MDINEALNIAKRLKGHFQAFEKLDEVIKECASLKSLMSEFEIQKAAIQEEITTLKEEKEQISKDVSSLEKEKEEAQGRLDAIKKEIGDIKVKLGIK